MQVSSSPTAGAAPASADRTASTTEATSTAKEPDRIAGPLLTFDPIANVSVIQYIDENSKKVTRQIPTVDALQTYQTDAFRNFVMGSGSKTTDTLSVDA